jgi:hypothetical protein
LSIPLKEKRRLWVKTTSIKTIRPIDEQSVSNAPWIAVKSAIKLTGLGERIIRQLPIKRFGKRDFANVSALNEFILGADKKRAAAINSSEVPAI